MATQEAKRLVPTFYHHPDLGPVCETKIGPEAGADTVIEKLSAEHARMHPAEYERFVSVSGIKAQVGTSLKKIPGVDDTVVSVLAVHGITDVEKFAAMDDVAASGLMPNNTVRALELRNTARILMSALHPQAPEDELAALRRQRDAALVERDAALKLADEATAAPVQHEKPARRQA